MRKILSRLGKIYKAEHLLMVLFVCVTVILLSMDMVDESVETVAAVAEEESRNADAPAASSSDSKSGFWQLFTDMGEDGTAEQTVATAYYSGTAAKTGPGLDVILIDEIGTALFSETEEQTISGPVALDLTWDADILFLARGTYDCGRFILRPSVVYTAAQKAEAEENETSESGAGQETQTETEWESETSEDGTGQETETEWAIEIEASEDGTEQESETEWAIETEAAEDGTEPESETEWESETPEDGAEQETETETETEDGNRLLSELKESLEAELEEYDGIWSVYVKNLDTDESFVINDQPMKSASVMKLFIMGTVYTAIDEGQLERNDEIMSLMDKMISYSDNASSNQLLYILGDSSYAQGIARVNEFIEEYGYSDMTIEYNGFSNSATVIDGSHNNQVAAKDVGQLLEDVYRRTWMSRAVSNEIEEMLLAQNTRYKIPAGLPDGVLCGNKTGEMDTAQNDAAIIYSDGCDYILVVLSNDWYNSSTAINRIAHISGVVYEFFN